MAILTSQPPSQALPFSQRLLGCWEPSLLAMTTSTDTFHWYCIHTRSKSEHIASAHLKLLDDVEVFCPRVRYQKNTKRGKVWFNEALFPGYTFARLNLGSHLRAVNATNAVLGVVSFGDNHPPVPDAIIEEWRSYVNDDALITIEDDLQAGDEIEVIDGPAVGIETVVTKVLPGKERVRILMEMLGQPLEIEVPREAVNRKGDVRRTTPKGAEGASSS